MTSADGEGLNHLADIFALLGQYSCLTDAYMIDYFVDNHWDQLPSDWKHLHTLLNYADLAQLLDLDRELEEDLNDKLPVSLLDLRQNVRKYSISSCRDLLSIFHGLPDNAEQSMEGNCCSQENNFYATFNDNVKLKKRHEIRRLTDFTLYLNRIVEKPFVHVEDIGAGLGHFSRLLWTKSREKGQRPLTVSSVDSNGQLIRRALFLDQKMEKNPKDQSHDECHIKRSIRNIDVLNPQAGNDYKYGCSDEDKCCLVGLHACGDLSAWILSRFNSDRGINAVISIGCCHHKINAGLDKKFRQNWSLMPINNDGSQNGDAEISLRGYPLSQTFRNFDCSDISWPSRELSCHAIEQFLEKLKCSSLLNLDVQVYRSILEWLIVKKYPKTRHMAVRVVLRTPTDFWQYLSIVTSKYPHFGDLSALRNDAPILADIDHFVSKSKQYFVFFSLRTLIAPLIESVILFDRLLYLRENGHRAEIVPLFDPKVSPRNIAVVAFKNRDNVQKVR